MRVLRTGFGSQHGRPMTGVRIRRETQNLDVQPEVLVVDRDGQAGCIVRGKVMQAVFLAARYASVGRVVPSIAQGRLSGSGKRTNGGKCGGRCYVATSNKVMEDHSCSLNVQFLFPCQSIASGGLG